MAVAGWIVAPLIAAAMVAIIVERPRLQFRVAQAQRLGRAARQSGRHG
jgi:hypothetical protein